MERKVKYDYKFKLLCIDEVLNKGYSIEIEAKSKIFFHFQTQNFANY